MWDFIDHAYVITLDSATERRGRIADALHFAQLAPKTTLYKAKKHAVSGKHGCWESHVAVVDLAKQAGYKVVLILEDDFQFTPDYQQHLPHVQEFVRVMPPTSWDFVMLGLFPIKTSAATELPAALQPRFQKVACGWQSHAYIVNTTVIQAGVQPRTLVPDVKQQIDARLFCGNLTEDKIYNYGVVSKPRVAAHGAHLPVYTTYALQPQIVVQAVLSASTASGMNKHVQNVLAKPKFMRALQTVSTHVDVPTFSWLLATLLVLTIASLISLVVVVCVRKTSRIY